MASTTVMTMASAAMMATMAVVVSVAPTTKIETECGTVGIWSAVVAVVLVIIVSPYAATVAVSSMPMASAYPDHRVNVAILRSGVSRVA